MNPFFAIFLVFAGLLALNGMRALWSASKPTRKRDDLVTGIISLVGAAGIALIGFYMFQF